MIVTPPEGPPLDTAEFDECLDRAAERLVRADVRAVVLLHGTFVGLDPLGLARKLSRVWPDASQRLQQANKRTLDLVVGDAGNFGRQPRRTLASAFRAVGGATQVRTLDWSSENHHAARADAAVRLLQLLSQLPADGRILLIGHSHGGNVLALVTQLLSVDRRARRSFFRAARSYYRARKVDAPRWPEVARWLDSAAFDKTRLDLVTLGTPVRYGWMAEGRRLLHLVHRRAAGETPWRAEFPPDPRVPGDLVQQLGIAGTNFPPSIFSWRARRANIRLSRLLQGGLRQRDLWKRLRRGVVLHDTGRTLLVDYAAVDDDAQVLLGHAVYTRERWLPFHLQQIAKHLYGCQ